MHDEYGAGWVQGSGVGRVTVRFETPWSAPGRVRTFAVEDPALRPGEPLPLVREKPTGSQSSEPAILPKSLSPAEETASEAGEEISSR